jgi:hypothetical protein
MNERIQKLIKQATTIEYGVDNGFDRVTFDKEKFAEIIVKECRNAISELDVDSPEATIALLMADGAIRSRFEIEQ